MLKVIVFIIIFILILWIRSFRYQWRWYRKMLGGKFYYHPDWVDGSHWDRGIGCGPDGGIEEIWSEKDGKKVAKYIEHLPLILYTEEQKQELKDNGFKMLDLIQNGKYYNWTKKEREDFVNSCKVKGTEKEIEWKRRKIE